MTQSTLGRISSQDIQMHSQYSDGLNSIEDMVKAAYKNKVTSCVITDHAKGWVSNGKFRQFFPTRERYMDYLKDLKSLKSIYHDDIKIYSGLEIEVSIHGEFKLDPGITDYCNAKLEKKYGVDIILGCIHSESFEEDYRFFAIQADKKRSALIKNMINLIKNPNIDIFAHPFQALHGQFSDNLTDEEGALILEAFKEQWSKGHQIFVELNGKKYPHYDQWIDNKYELGLLKTHDFNFLRKYRSIGGKFVLGSDAHAPSDYANLDFSIIEELNLSQSDIFIF